MEEGRDGMVCKLEQEKYGTVLYSPLIQPKSNKKYQLAVKTSQGK